MDTCALEASVPETSDREAGTTLIELLVTVVIMGLAVVALLGGLSTAVIVSDQHRQQAVAGGAVRNFAEAVSGASYTPCASAAAITSAAGYTAPPDYARTVTQVWHWKPATRSWETSGCSPSTDGGAQKVSLQVKSNRSNVVAKLDVVLRKAAA